MPLSYPAWASISLESVAPEVRVTGQAQRLADGRVAGVDHRRLDGAHRGRARAHVHDGRRAAPHDGRPGLRQLVEDDAGQGLRRVLDDGPDERHRRRDAGQRHGDELRRHARPGEVHDVAARELGPGQGRGRTDVEDGPRPLRQRVMSAGVDRQQVDHDRRPARRERPGHHRLGRVHEAQEQAVQVADLGWDVVGDDGRGDSVVRRKRIGHADDPGQVRGLRPARVQGVGIQHLHAGRPGVEVDDALPVARRRVAGPVEQAELAGDRVQRAPDHCLGDGDPLAVCGGAVRHQQGDGLGLLHLDAGPLQQLQGLVHDAVDEAGVEELETGSHLGLRAVVGRIGWAGMGSRPGDQATPAAPACAATSRRSSASTAGSSGSGLWSRRSVRACSSASRWYLSGSASQAPYGRRSR